MAALLLESEIKGLLAAKSLQMSFTVSNRETIGRTVKAVKADVRVCECKYTDNVIAFFIVACHSLKKCNSVWVLKS